MFKKIKIADSEFAVPTTEAYNASKEMQAEFQTFCKDKGFSEEETVALVAGVQDPASVPVESHQGIASMAGRLEEIGLTQLAERIEAAGLTEDFAARSGALTVDDHVSLLNTANEEELLTVLSAIPVPQPENTGAGEQPADSTPTDPVVFEETKSEPTPDSETEPVTAVVPTQTTDLQIVENIAPAVAVAIVQHAAQSSELDAQQHQIMSARSTSQATLYRSLAAYLQTLKTPEPAPEVVATVADETAAEAV